MLIEKNKEIDEINNLMGRLGLFEKRGGFIGCPLLLFEKFGKVITEGLIKSYDADFILRTIKRRFLITDNWEEYLEGNSYQGYIQTDSGTLRFGRKEKEISVIELVIPNDKKDIERLSKFIEACGWYMASKDATTECKSGDILLVFEKKYQRALKNNGVEVPNVLYHITQECYVDKILKNGLVPKAGNKLSKHPERIYFLTSKPKDDILWQVAKQFFIRNDSNKYVIRNSMVLLSVNISRHKKQLKFFSDPNYDECVYTYDNISTDCIVGVEEIPDED